MGNSRWSGSLISGGGILAAGTTYFNTQAGSAATVIADGSIQATTYVKSGTYLKSTTYTQSGTGYITGKGDYKQYAAGTVYCTGGASSPIVATGLTTIHHVFMNRRVTGYVTATTNNVLCRPSIAGGTLGSFYPIAFKHTGVPASIWALGSVAATFTWFAVGAKTIT
jgi:hypothetical protein